MQTSINIVFLVSIATLVWCSPIVRNKDTQSDAVEQELVRHHHATSEANTASSDIKDVSANSADDKEFSADSYETDAASPIESIEEDNGSDSDDSGVTQYDEQDLYDITVGDVIRDVLLTLRDHPEIVKELVASEKEKLVDRIENQSVYETDSVGDHLSNFELPAEQLQNAPKRVEKKTGRSGMQVVPGGKDIKESKRKDEIIDANYGNNYMSGGSSDIGEFFTWPSEGGLENAMFGIKEASSDNTETNSIEEKDDEKRGHMSESEIDSYSVESDSDGNQDTIFHNDTEDEHSVNDTNEDELAWLLQRARAEYKNTETEKASGVPM